jgi:CheY-like chemotaxis protein
MRENRILVIDDDPDIRTVLEHLLKKNGYETETASQKDEAFQKISIFKPSLILMDVLLSGQDGRSICRELKDNPLTRDISIIMCSAHPSAGSKLSEYGADDFIGKPFNKEILLQKVEQHLRTILNQP